MVVRTPSELGALIRDRRRKLGIDQALLAEKAGTSRQWIVAVEQGKPRAEIGLVLRTLAALGLSLTATAKAAGRPRQAKAGEERPPIDINQIISSLQKPRR
jgi:HTH-type transcriptional regulator / antitoxin HipB